MKGKNKKKEEISHFPGRRRENQYSVYRFISMVGILIIIGMLVILGTQYVKYYRVKKDLAEFETRIREYEVRMNELSTEVERLQEIDYIEILARKRLGLVKPGEIIFQFED